MKFIFSASDHGVVNPKDCVLQVDFYGVPFFFFTISSDLITLWQIPYKNKLIIKYEIFCPFQSL